MNVYPKLIDATTDVLEDFKVVRSEALAAGGVSDIDIAIYLTDVNGQVYLGHTEIIDRPLPPRKFVKAVHELVRGLRAASPAPWSTLTMCVDTWTAPNTRDFVDVGSMASDHAWNPASKVRSSITVFTVDSEGVQMCAYASYTLGDDGLPVWSETRIAQDPPGLAPRVLAHAALA